MLDHLSLPLFNNIKSLGSRSVITGTEGEIIDDYKNALTRGEKCAIIIHCYDQPLIDLDFLKIARSLEGDLIANPNLHVILMTAYNLNYIVKPSPHLPNFRWIYFPEYNGIYWNLYKDLHPRDPSGITKRFLSLNKRGDIYRQSLYYYFHANDLLKNNIFSYLCEDELLGNLHDGDTFERIHESILQRNDLMALAKHRPPEKYAAIHSDQHLIGYQSYDGNSVDPSWLVDKNWYDQTFCSLVLETDADRDAPNLSEKTFRSICMEHPLFVFGAPGTYGFLREMGLELEEQNKLWDSAGDHRFAEFLKNIDRISGSDMNTLMRRATEMRERAAFLRSQYGHLHGAMMSRQERIWQDILHQLEAWKFNLL